MADRGLAGALVVDKPEGPTSHDIVARVRRGLGLRRVGHAGTLDPMASGVLVVLVGEATKLEPFVSAARKTYLATLAFGRSTDTLDRLGTVSEEAPVPGELSAELASISRSTEPLDASWAFPSIHAALGAELARTEQMPPLFSAIQVGGERSYARARRGEDFELPARPVHLEAATVVGANADASTLDVGLVTSKGYYVRAFARDVGVALGCPCHLTALRRTASGVFTEHEATSLEAPREVLVERLVSLEALAARSLASSTLTATGVDRARKGQPLEPSDFVSAPSAGAWFDAEGRLVCVGVADGDGLRSKRGFV